MHVDCASAGSVCALASHAVMRLAATQTRTTAIARVMCRTFIANLQDPFQGSLDGEREGGERFGTLVPRSARGADLAVGARLLERGPWGSGAIVGDQAARLAHQV